MLKSICLIFSFTFLVSSSVDAKEKIKIGDLIREANFSVRSGDMYKAYRLYNYVESRATSTLVRYGWANYLETLRVIGSGNAVRNKCKSLAAKVGKKYQGKFHYHCARVAFLAGKDVASVGHLRKISLGSKYFPMASILWATLHIKKEEGPKCIKRVSRSYSGKFKAAGIEDIYLLTRARCLVSYQKYARALSAYQEIDQSSTYYHTVLEEIAWTHFKLRNLEKTSEVLSILIDSFDGVDKVMRKTISDKSYFRLRYLQAYIDLYKQGVELVDRKFVNLRKHIVSYRKSDDTLTSKSINELAELVANKNMEWADLQSAPSSVLDLLDFLRVWATADAYRSVTGTISLKMATSRENKRIKSGRLGKTKEYGQSIKKLDAVAARLVKRNIESAVMIARRNLKSLEFKSEMGKIELNWVNRNEGVRDSDQLLQGYQDDVNSVEEFIGG